MQTFLNFQYTVYSDKPALALPKWENLTYQGTSLGSGYSVLYCSLKAKCKNILKYITLQALIIINHLFSRNWTQQN